MGAISRAAKGALSGIGIGRLAAAGLGGPYAARAGLDSRGQAPHDHKAVKTFAFQFGSFRGEAVPKGASSSRSGQTRYEVSLYLPEGVVRFPTKLTGQIGPEQLLTGTALRRQLEQALQASRHGGTQDAGPACRVSAAPVMGSNGRPAHVQREGLTASFFDKGFTTTVRLPLYKDDNWKLGGYFTRVGGMRVPVGGWSPEAAQGSGSKVIQSLRAQGRIDPSLISKPSRTHQQVKGSDGQLYWVPVAGKSRLDGNLAFWAYHAAGLAPNSVPKGGTPEFGHGWDAARRDRGLLEGMAVVDGVLGILGAGAGATRGLRPLTRGARQAGGPNVAWGGPTKVTATGTIAVSNGGRLLPQVRMAGGRPAAQVRPANAPMRPPERRPLTSAGGVPRQRVIDVEVISSKIEVSAPAARAAGRPKPLPSAKLRASPEAPPIRNEPIVRRAAEMPELPHTTPAGQEHAIRRQPAVSEPATRGLSAVPVAIPSRPQRALPSSSAPAQTPSAAGVAGATVSSTQPRSQGESSNSIRPGPGRNVVYQQQNQWPNQAPPDAPNQGVPSGGTSGSASGPGGTAIDQAAGYPKDVSALYESLRNLKPPKDRADSKRLERFILGSLLKMSLDASGRIDINTLKQATSDLKQASSSSDDNINLDAYLQPLKKMGRSLENLRWRHEAIEAAPSKLEKILGDQDTNAVGEKPAVIFDYDGTMVWADGSELLPMNLIGDESEWLLARLSADGYKDYADSKIEEFEARNEGGVAGVPIQPVLDAARLAQSKGLSVFVVTSAQHKDKVSLILSQLEKWGLSDITVYQTGYGQQKTDLIDEKIVSEGYVVRATVGDSEGGDEYRPHPDQAAPFIWVPSRMVHW